MNYPGIFGSHPEDQYRARELDRHLDACEPWSTDDIEKAKQGLYYDIRFNGKLWDENLVSYRADMIADWYETMLSNMPNWEKTAEMFDALDKYIKLYCEDEVEQDPDAYCELYCSQFENEE